MLTVSAGEAEFVLEFDQTRGTYGLRTGEEPLLRDARVVAAVRRGRRPEELAAGGPWEPSKEEASDGSIELSCRAGGGRLLFRARPAAHALILEAGLSWDSPGEPPALEALCPLVTPPGSLFPGRESLAPWRVYLNGWQCWTPSGTLSPRRPGDALYPLYLPRFLKPMLANTATPVSSDRGSFSSEWFSGIADTERGDSLVVGFTGLSAYLSQVSFRLGRRASDSRLEAACRLEGRRPVPGRVLWSEPLALIPGDLSGGNLELYCEMTAAAQGVQTIRCSPPGWSSWYQYFRDVSYRDVAANLDLLSGRYRDLGIELVQVDDGYQADIGDWLETTDSFTEGMRRLASEVSGRGKIPGIWVAPFTVTRGSRLFREKR